MSAMNHIKHLAYVIVSMSSGLFLVCQLSAAEGKTDTTTEVIKEIVSLFTDITSDSLDFDINKKQAIFLGNVTIEDEKLTMYSDKLIVEFDENDELKKIEADGNVKISSDNNEAVGGKAVYDFAKGDVILSNNPVLIKGYNQIEGAEKIIYSRDKGKFKTEGGQVHLVIKKGDHDDHPLNKLFTKPKAEDDKRE